MRTVVIKAGGRAAENRAALESLASEIHGLSDLVRFVFVHGGGAAVSSIQQTYGVEPRFIDGKRLTSPSEMDLVDMGLSGLMNTCLVRLFQKQGLQAIGLSGVDGALFTGASLTDPAENRTGEVIEVKPELILLLEKEGYLPVVCSVSTDREGNGININADEAALALAVALKADDLLFISDIPGIMKEGTVALSLNKKEAEQWITEGTIAGGMIPKVQSSLTALAQGVGTIVIGDYKKKGDLEGLLNFTRGTGISL